MAGCERRDAVTDPHESPAAAAIEAPLGKRLSPLVPPWRMPLPIPEESRMRVIKYVLPSPDQKGSGRLLDILA